MPVERAGEKKVFRYSWRPMLTILGLATSLVVVISLLSGFSAVGVAVIYCMAFLPAAYFASLALRVRLVIDEKGVSFIERSETKAVSWDNLHAVASTAVQGRKGIREYRLLNHGNVVISFESEIGDSERAYRTIERRISVDLYPRYREALDRGDQVSFGVVNLSRHAINIRNVNLAVPDARLVRGATSLELLRRSTGEVVMSVDEGEVHNINILMRCATELDSQLVGTPRASARAA